MKLQTINYLAALLALDTVQAIDAAAKIPALAQNTAETVRKNEAAAADIDGVDIYRRVLTNIISQGSNVPPSD